MGFAVPWLKSRQPGDYRRAARAPLPGDRTPQVPALLGTARSWRGIVPFTHLAREGRMTVTIGRRELLAALGGAVVTWPLAARAQQPKVPTIGALVIGNISPEEFWREFRQGLRDLGYIEGQNIRFEFRSAEGQINRLPELAAELVRLKVDVIVTWFTPTAVAAKQATREIPIVMAETGDPIGTGLVASLPQPGGNVTGIAAVTAELAGKSIQLIRDMLPSARRVTALANATDPRFRGNKRSPATLMVASVWSLGEDPKPTPRVPCQPSNCEIRLDHRSTVGSSCMVRTHAAFHSALVMCVS